MFFKKRKRNCDLEEVERDIWGRKPLALYEKIGSVIERDPNSWLRTTDGAPIHDLFVLFEQKKPDIRGNGGLIKAGEWTNYGSKLYRVNTLLSIAELKTLLLEELDLEEKDILVSSSKVDPRILDI